MLNNSFQCTKINSESLASKPINGNQFTNKQKKTRWNPVLSIRNKNTDRKWVEHVDLNWRVQSFNGVERVLVWSSRSLWHLSCAAPASQWNRESDRKVVIFGCFRLIVMILDDVQLRCCFISRFLCLHSIFQMEISCELFVMQTKGIKTGRKLNKQQDDAVIKITQLTTIYRSVSIFT